jgi:hypothetical protein
MEAMSYDKFKWKICGDLKVIALLLGLQQGFKKYCCFITQEMIGLPENLWNQESSMWKINH